MDDHNSRLLAAARRGDADAVRAALEAGAAVETRDEELRSPLLLASLGNHVAAARVLVEAGADPNAQDRRHDSAWLVTGVTGSVAMMRTLLPAGPDTTLRNRFGGISLIPASEHGHVAYVRAVLRETDIHVDHVNDLGWTALLEAVILGDGGRPHQEVVELLLAAGADPDLADADGVTPLRHAERRGFDAIAALLGAKAR
ncbi:ankyrin repeat domain-containing protein [Streptomyces sp. NPDC005828]|uniref:ankyrin repeat domain-containing protein n=1 Tax=Streptomyces sp. NPDC005828 TaxID=3157071 RepID=UPI0033EEFC6E